MKTETLFTLLVLLPKIVALALLMVATTLFTSIQDAYQTNKFQAPFEPLAATARKVGPQSSAQNESSVTQNVHPVERHNDVEMFTVATTVETTTHRVRSTWKPKSTTTTRRPPGGGYGYGGYYGRSAAEKREPADDALEELDIRLGRSKRHSDTLLNSEHSSEIVRPAVHNSNDDASSRFRPTAVDDSAIHFHDHVEDDSRSQEKYSFPGQPCDMSVVRMFWGISIAVMVIAIMQLLGTALCFSMITSNARNLAGLWMVATMVMTVAFAILAYLSMYYFHNNACPDVPDFDQKWLMMSIFLVLDPAMLIVLIIYTYYVFKIKSDKLLDRHETDSQRIKRGYSKTSSLLNYIYGPNKSYDR